MLLGTFAVTTGCWRESEVACVLLGMHFFTLQEMGLGCYPQVVQYPGVGHWAVYLCRLQCFEDNCSLAYISCCSRSLRTDEHGIQHVRAEHANNAARCCVGVRW